MKHIDHDSVFEMFSLHEAADVHASIARSLELVNKILRRATSLMENDEHTDEEEIHGNSPTNFIEAGFAYYCSLALFATLLDHENVEGENRIKAMDCFDTSMYRVFSEHNVSMEEVFRFSSNTGFSECALFSGGKMAEAILSAKIMTE